MTDTNQAHVWTWNLRLAPWIFWNWSWIGIPLRWLNLLSLLAWSITSRRSIRRTLEIRNCSTFNATNCNAESNSGLPEEIMMAIEMRPACVLLAPNSYVLLVRVLQTHVLGCTWLRLPRRWFICWTRHCVALKYVKVVNLFFHHHNLRVFAYLQNSTLSSKSITGGVQNIQRN